MEDKPNVYHLLNETHSEFLDYEEATVSDAEKVRIFRMVKEKARLAKTPRRSAPILISFAIAAVLLFLIGSSSSFGQRVQAGASSFLDSIHYSFSKLLGKEANEENTTLVVSQTAELGSAEVKLEDILFFDNRLIINLLVDLKEPMEEPFLIDIQTFELAINGQKPITVYQTGRTIKEKHGLEQILYTADFERELLSGNMQIDIKLQDLLLYVPTEASAPPRIEGNAHFSLETTGEELKKQIKQYDINQSVKTKDYSYKFDKLHMHPLLSYIELSSSDPEQPYQVMELRGQNEAGEKITFSRDTYKIGPNLWEATMIFDEEQSEITSEELAQSKALTLQLYSAGHPEGPATFNAYGEIMEIDLTEK